MKTIKIPYIVFPFLLSFIISNSATASNSDKELEELKKEFVANNPPVAENDTFFFLNAGINPNIEGNILQNDYDPEGDEFILSFIQKPNKGSFEIDCDGYFTFSISEPLNGSLNFPYKICEVQNPLNYSEAILTIIAKTDSDWDGVPDDNDVDNDNDGITDIDDGVDIDSDNDGIPNYRDIDSDNDGIPDNFEGQEEGHYIEPLNKDDDFDGLDKAYDSDENGYPLLPCDSDTDGTPDFIDSNSDDDDFMDIEEILLPNSSTQKIVLSGNDADNDGLDDIFDTVDGFSEGYNSIGTNIIIPDEDSDGTRDWRDFNGNKSIPGENSSLDESGILLFPNPTNQQFYVELPAFIDHENIELEIYDITGKLTYNTIIQNSLTHINPGYVEQGTYIVRIKSNSIYYTGRLVITKN